MSDKTSLSPISALTAAQGHVLILSTSGTPATPLSTLVGYRDTEGEIRSLGGNSFDALGLPVIGFMPLPWSEAEAEALITSQEAGDAIISSATITGTLCGPDLSIAAFEIVNDAEFIGAEKAMDQIAELLGLYETGFEMPSDAGPIVREVRALAIEVLGNKLPAEAAIEVARRLIDGSAVAEDKAEDHAVAA